MMLWCCGCNKTIEARLTNGSECYPSRSDLWRLPFWKCDACGNFVGCHHKTSRPTMPLGNIPSLEMKKARIHIHALIDPLYKNGPLNRNEVYKKISEILGWDYHTAKTRSIEECREAYRAGLKIKKQLGM